MKLQEDKEDFYKKVLEIVVQKAVAAGGKYFRWGCGNGDQTILEGSGGMLPW